MSSHYEASKEQPPVVFPLSGPPVCVSFGPVLNHGQMRPVHDKNTGATFIELNCSIPHATTPDEKFYLVPSREHEGLVHIRCCGNNKYWVAERRENCGTTAWFICGSADEPEEDVTSRHAPCSTSGLTLTHLQATTTRDFIKNYIAELELAEPAPRSVCDLNSRTTTRARIWIAPHQVISKIKINVDGAAAKAEDGGSVAAVCCDGQGVFIGASSLATPGISDPAAIESIACREALALPADLNLTNICVASDSLEVLNKCSPTSK